MIEKWYKNVCDYRKDMLKCYKCWEGNDRG